MIDPAPSLASESDADLIAITDPPGKDRNMYVHRGKPVNHVVDGDTSEASTDVTRDVSSDITRDVTRDLGVDVTFPSRQRLRAISTPGSRTTGAVGNAAGLAARDWLALHADGATGNAIPMQPADPTVRVGRSLDAGFINGGPMAGSGWLAGQGDAFGDDGGTKLNDPGALAIGQPCPAVPPLTPLPRPVAPAAPATPGVR